MASFQQCWKTLSVSLVDSILTISMNRPKVNAMSIGLFNDLEQAFDHASKTENIRGVHLRSNFSSTFCAGLDVSEMYERCSSRNRSVIEKFMFDTLSRGATSAIRCTKPVACSLNGHAIGGGLVLALTCDYIAIGTQKTFYVGLTESAVGIPFPLIPLQIVRHQIEPQLAYRLITDANIISSTDLSIRCERSDKPDDLANKWLKMISQRPLKGFQITKKKWWEDKIRLDEGENEQQKQAYIDTITSDECLQAMKQTLNKKK